MPPKISLLRKNPAYAFNLHICAGQTACNDSLWTESCLYKFHINPTFVLSEMVKFECASVGHERHLNIVGGQNIFYTTRNLGMNHLFVLY